MGGRVRIEWLTSGHDVALFDCGQEAMNRFLVDEARDAQQAGASETFVGLIGDEVVGFYTLVPGRIDDPEPAADGNSVDTVPQRPMQLARFAVATRWQDEATVRVDLFRHAMARDVPMAPRRLPPVKGPFIDVPRSR